MSATGHDDFRRHRRQASDVPIEVRLDELVVHRKEYLTNISLGGLCFKSAVYVHEGTLIDIRIPLVDARFHSRGRVVWCQKNADYYDVGVEFISDGENLRRLVVEQVCHIQNFKTEIFAREGRQLTGEEAALEWIARIAGDLGARPPA